MHNVTIYSDGAVSPNPGFGGWAVLLMFNKTEHKTVAKLFSGRTRDTTNQRMELMAVVVGLESLKARCHVTVYSDSKYVINGITKWISGWKAGGWKTKKGDPVKHQDLWMRLYSAAFVHKVEYEWVKGHADDFWNEIVDEIAVHERLQAKMDSLTGASS